MYYHTNAMANVHIRSQIYKSNQTNKESVIVYLISTVKISKLRYCTHIQDKRSKPLTIHYAITSLERTIIQTVRQSTWLSLDEIWDMMQQVNPNISRSTVYRTFVREGLNRLPEKDRKKAKKFKAYEQQVVFI